MEKQNEGFHQKFINSIRLFNKFFFNRITLRIARRGKSPFSIVRQTGRRTGRIYETPVLASYIGKTVVIPLSYGENVDWLRNILRQGGCEIFWKDQWIHAANPMVIESVHALEILPKKRRKLLTRFKVNKFLQLEIQTGGI